MIESMRRFVSNSDLDSGIDFSKIPLPNIHGVQSRGITAASAHGVNPAAEQYKFACKWALWHSLPSWVREDPEITIGKDPCPCTPCVQGKPVVPDATDVSCIQSMNTLLTHIASHNVRETPNQEDKMAALNYAVYHQWSSAVYIHMFTTKRFQNMALACPCISHVSGRPKQARL